MSKSTPISQLPTNSNGMNDLMLDEDDDDAVREVLSQYQASQTQSQPQYQQELQQPMMMPQMPPQQMYNPQQMAPVMPRPLQMDQSDIKQSRYSIDFDFKTIIAIIFIVVFVQVFPIETFVYKYISIEHIPYASVILKALSAGVLFIIYTKYIQ